LLLFDVHLHNTHNLKKTNGSSNTVASSTYNLHSTVDRYDQKKNYVGYSKPASRSLLWQDWNCCTCSMMKLGMLLPSVCLPVN